MFMFIVYNRYFVNFSEAMELDNPETMEKSKSAVVQGWWWWCKEFFSGACPENQTTEYPNQIFQSIIENCG